MSPALRACLLSALLLAGTGARAQEEPPTGPQSVEEGEEETEGVESTEGGDEEGEPAPPLLDLDVAVERATSARKEILGSRAYEFCNDEDWTPLGAFGDTLFCGVFDEQSREACPAAEQLCAKKEPFRFELPSWLAWALIGGLLLAALVAFSRVLAKARAELGHEEILEGDGGELGHGPARALPEAAAVAILRRARASQEQGRIDEAAVLLQLAALRYLDANGLVQFHPSRTNGEYLRAIRQYRALAELYRGVARQTDRARFGDGRVEGKTVEALLSMAETLLVAPPGEAPQSAASVPLVITLALLAGSLLGCDRIDRPYFSHRPAGLAAFPALLKQIGLPLELSNVPLSEIPADVGVVILRSKTRLSLEPVEQKLDALLDRDLAVIVLDDSQVPNLFLPVTSTVPAGAKRTDGLAQGLSLSPSDETFCGIDLPALGEQISPRMVRLPLGAEVRWNGRTSTAPASVHDLEIYPLLGAAFHADGSITASAMGGVRTDQDGGYLSGCILLFNEELFSNASLAFPGNAAFIGGLFSFLVRNGERILILEDASGSDKDKGIGRSVAESRLLPLIIQGGLAVALLFLFLGAAFGPLSDPVEKQHKAFVEHVDAVGHHYAQAGSAGVAHAARALARLILARYRHEARRGQEPRGQETGWQGIARHLAAKHGFPEEEVQAALRLGLEAKADTASGRAESVSGKTLAILSTLLSGREQKKGQKRRQQARR